jgi:N-acetylneuraminate synthase
LNAPPILFSPGKCVVIGEVAQAHDGSLGLAHAFIDAIAKAGADGVKFQTHIAAAESTPSEVWRVRFSLQDASRYEYWRRMEFSEEQWAGLRRHANERGLLFLSSPFSIEAFELLDRVGVALWKIASGEVANNELLDLVATNGRPVLLSTGFSNWAAIDRAVARLRSEGVSFGVLQCTSIYPCPAEKVGLNLLQVLRERYGCPVGLSDHSGTIYPSLAAASLGASAIEVHVTMSREMFGPDVVASVTSDELRQLVDGVRFIERMLGASVDKDEIAGELSSTRVLFERSLAVRHDLGAGHSVVKGDLVAKKPGTGLAPERLAEVLGKRLRRPLAADTLISLNDLED